MRLILNFLCGFCWAAAAIAQYEQRQYDIPFSINGQELPQALAGGLNSCQMSKLDVNMDGVEDLFFFDRQTARISIFLNMNPTPGVVDYKYTLAYNSAFPIGLRNWVLLRDMNCDGKKDICANTGSGMRIFWNTSESELSFASNSTGAIGAFYDFGNGNSFDATVFSIAPDVPAIDDYEGDGDLDVWSWNDNAAGLYFFENRAADNGDCSVPDFECRGRWYGKFNEGPDSFTILTGEDFSNDFDIANPRNQRDGMHTGGTVLTIDLDQNGIKDIVAGDVTESYMAALLLMNGASQRDSVFEVQTNFPQEFGASLSVDVKVFPAGFYEDIDNDGIRDLIVTTNDDVNGSVDQRSVWYFHNNGLNDLPSFEFVTDAFLQEQMIDMGTGSMPVVFDVDQDGLNDIIISNRRYFDNGNLNTSVLWLFKNIGSTTAPAFELIDDNWLDIESFSWKSIYPCFYDFDNDGDVDLFAGELEGELKVFENIAGEGNPLDLIYIGPLLDSDGAIIDPGQYSVPQCIDLDDDDLEELIIGELNGHINVYQNIGTADNNQWTLLDDSLGHAVATSFLGIQGRAIPHFFRNNLGNLELLMGTETGNVMHYGDITLNEDFTLNTSTYLNVFEGFRSAPYMADLNGNDQLDFLIGNMAGGLGIYYDAFARLHEEIIAQNLLVYPNPNNGLFMIDCRSLKGSTTWQMLDAMGRMVANGNLHQALQEIETPGLSNGFYVLTIGDGRHVKVIISN
jgi:hypothetical protein